MVYQTLNIVKGKSMLDQDHQTRLRTHEHPARAAPQPSLHDRPGSLPSRVDGTEDIDCFAMTRWDFMAEPHTTAKIAVNVIRVLVRRLRETIARLSE